MTARCRHARSLRRPPLAALLVGAALALVVTASPLPARVPQRRLQEDDDGDYDDEGGGIAGDEWEGQELGDDEFFDDDYEEEEEDGADTLARDLGDEDEDDELDELDTVGGEAADDGSGSNKKPKADFHKAVSQLRGSPKQAFALSRKCVFTMCDETLAACRDDSLCSEQLTSCIGECVSGRMMDCLTDCMSGEAKFAGVTDCFESQCKPLIDKAIANGKQGKGRDAGEDAAERGDGAQVSGDDDEG